MNVGDKKIVSVGYVRPATSDNDIMRLGGLPAGLESLKYDFDAHYEEAGRHPMKFCYSMHNYVGGRVGMSRLFDEFLQYVKGRSGVWFCRSIDMANFWLEHEGR